MRSPSRRRTRGPGTIDGLKVRISEGPEAGGAELGRALKLLVKLMLRNHQHAGDHEAIIPASQSPSTLTVLPHTSPDHTDEAA